MRTLLPLLAWLIYHFLVLLLTFYGPLRWNITNTDELVAFIILSNCMFAFGYLVALLVKPRSASRDFTIPLFKLGAILTLLLLIPSMQIYTGKGIGDIYSAAQDQGEAWRQTQQQIRDASSSRTGFALLRGLLAPFTLAVVPIFLLRWHLMGFFWRVVGTAAILSILVFSIARGTDKETIELGLLFGFSFLARQLTVGKWNAWVGIRQVMGLLLVGLVIFSAVNLFAVRKNSRLGEVFVYCQSTTLECADYNHPLLSWLPDDRKGSAAVIVNYLTQGHYGLSLALKQDFESTMGIGHSRFLMAQLERVNPDSELLSRSFNYKLDQIGWPSKHTWNTAYVQIANDLGFLATSVAMFLWGFFICVVWRDFLHCRNMHAYLMSVCFVITLFYMPMNLQITQTVDYYFPAIIWAILWFFTRSRSSARVQVNNPGTSNAHLAR